MIRLTVFGAILGLLMAGSLISDSGTPTKTKQYPDISYHFPDSDRWPDVRKGPNRNLKTKDHE